MFRTFSRKWLPNRLDWMLKRAARRRCKNILICWNRGLGDIPLGIAAIVHRIFHYMPQASIHILTRSNLQEGFSLLQGVNVFVDPTWKRGEPIDWRRSLTTLGIDESAFDLVLDAPSPTDWCPWQYKTFTPRLAWNSGYDSLVDSFQLSDEFFYIGVQVETETNHGAWRNWPEKYWQELFDRFAAMGKVRVLLFGFETRMQFSHSMIIDLRGKTTLLELLSIIKNRCSALVLPDSGILSFFYYLDVSFPIRVVSLWADPWQGILKQGVSSPNLQLTHIPLMGKERNLSNVLPCQIVDALFPKFCPVPLRSCTKAEEVQAIDHDLKRAACIIMAGGQGSRLGISGPKGLFSILGKTLFQHLVEKVPVSMPIAIMTSPFNHEETVAYFVDHAFFGRQISFFRQEMIDLLDEHYLAIGKGPNGNGSLFYSLTQSGILDHFEHNGIDTLLIAPIENPLANPADAALLAFHRQMEAEVTIQCVERKKNELLGALAIHQGKILIAEYLTIQEDNFLFSYTGQLALSTYFIRQAASLSLPYHWVRKKCLIDGKEKFIWKREKFIFDAFSIAASIKALCYNREASFAPIKELNNIGVVEALLQGN